MQKSIIRHYVTKLWNYRSDSEKKKVCRKWRLIAWRDLSLLEGHTGQRNIFLQSKKMSRSREHQKNGTVRLIRLEVLAIVLPQVSKRSRQSSRIIQRHVTKGRNHWSKKMSKKVLREIAGLPTTFNKPSLVCNHYFSLIKEGLKYHI